MLTGVQILVVEQIVPMLGLEAVVAHNAPHQPLSKLVFLLKRIKHANLTTTAIAFTSLGILIACRVGKGLVVQRPGGRWVRFVPEILIMVVTATSKSSAIPSFAGPTDLPDSPHWRLSMGPRGRASIRQNQRWHWDPIRSAFA